MLGSLILTLASTYNPSTLNTFAKTQQEERQLEDLIPKHVPLRTKIRKEKEKEFRDLTNQNWIDDLEIEVTNIGDKPIYSFYLMLVTELKWENGDRVVFSVDYGRTELGDHRVRATSYDIPVKPGESVVLRLHSGLVSGWKKARLRENRPQPKRIRVMLETLSFGDGTGYIGEDGLAVPHKSGGQSLCVPPPIRGVPKVLEWRLSVRGNPPSFSFIPSVILPASFLPVSFLSADSPNIITSRPEPMPDFCCPYGCTSLIPHTEHPCVNCPNQTRFTITYCADPDGGCYNPSYDHVVCTIPQTGQEYWCQTI
jgi:hypothetical protein